MLPLCVEILRVTHSAMCIWRRVKIRDPTYAICCDKNRFIHARASYLQRSFRKMYRGEINSRMTQLLESFLLPIGKEPFYLRVQFTLGAVLAHQKSAWLVRLHSALGELRDFELVRVAHRR